MPRNKSLSDLIFRISGANGQCSENQRANIIIVHEPDMPAFMGALHPDGSLYEGTVDLFKAQKEHKNMVAVLQKNGVEVVRVRDVLKMDCEEDLRQRLKLEQLAAMHLTYKLDDSEGDKSTLLSEHDWYLMSDQYKEKIISEMSIDQIVDLILTKPTISLRKADLNTALCSTSVSFSPLSNLVFCRDQQITTNRGVVLGQLNSITRAPERVITRFCFNKLGMKIIGEIPEGGALEGGDFFPAGEMCFIGLGLRTNWAAIHYCFNNDLFGSSLVAVVKDCFDWSQERMHLDTFWNIVHDDACAALDTILDSKIRRLVDLFERQVDGTYKLVMHDVEFLKFLGIVGYHIIPLTETDQQRYGLNFLNIGNGHLICPDMESARKIAKDLHGTGKIEVIDYKHVSAMYGSIHCSTQVVSRERSEVNAKPTPKIDYSALPPLWPASRPRRQTTDTIMMCPPTGFFYNHQAASDNTFMIYPHLTQNQVQRLAMKEYSEFHRMLTSDFGINVHMAISDRIDTPDAVFLKNWFSTHATEGGEPTMVLYPMRAQNRRTERVPETINRLKSHYTKVIDLTSHETAESPLFLEGNGVLVLDRQNMVAYVCQSSRASVQLAKEWCQLMGYTFFSLGKTKDSHSKEVHHTDFVMSITTTLAVVCFEAIQDVEIARQLREKLSATHSVLEISLAQMHKFCANLIELDSPRTGKPVLVMSEKAHQNYSPEQLAIFEQHYPQAIGKADIPVIENYGGGGVRCCIAELF
ncbi:hypothetical protein PROFUN_01406 [Planoprotostelium fungivorum]|uniref:Amidinotransferase n=1 Tax=Planoprotostelium fungivorum TaxID=1890364 RepID=A0A2P6NT66_9EUKA|nr:hypothetical protein PROFUN_01406 [Planoprotostelium fungivorum]